MQYFIGIDVSKAKLDVALLAHDKFKSKVFANNTAGFEALLQWLQTHVPEVHTSLHLCMEATGSYHEALACFLSDQALWVSVVNPLLVKRFAEANRLRNKTDGGDAKCLALFCRSTGPERWEAPSKAVRTLQALVARLDTLQAMRQAECNRLEVAHSSVADSVQEVIDDLDKAIAKVKAQIASTVDDDPDLKQRAALLQSIPGLGNRTIPQLLAYVGKPDRFKSVKALIAYAALTPLIRQSGTSLDRRRGTHPMGIKNSNARCTLRPWWQDATTLWWQPSGPSSKRRTSQARSLWWRVCTSFWQLHTASCDQENPSTPIT